MARPINIPQAKEYFGNTYNSLSGVNIKAVFFGVTFGNLQAISYSITREKAPIYTMGSPEVRGYSRGKRAIAGSLVFIMFDNHALLTAVQAVHHANSNDDTNFVVVDKTQVRPPTPEYQSTFLKGGVGQTTTSNLAARNAQGVVDVGAGRSAYLNAQQSLGTTLEAAYERVAPWYSDQLPPFNVVLTGVNEEGAGATMSIFGIEILNEGFGISIDDIVSEQQMTYVARAISRWTRLLSPTLGGQTGDQYKYRAVDPLAIG